MKKWYLFENTYMIVQNANNEFNVVEYAGINFEILDEKNDAECYWKNVLTSKDLNQVLNYLELRKAVPVSYGEVLNQFLGAKCAYYDNLNFKLRNRDELEQLKGELSRLISKYENYCDSNIEFKIAKLKSMKNTISNLIIKIAIKKDR